MEWPNCKFIAITLTAHIVYVFESSTGEILCQFPYPPMGQPTSLTLNETGEKACLTLTENDQGYIYILNLKQQQSYRLPLAIPAPQQFTITPDFQHAYLAANATIYQLNLATLQCRAFTKPDQGNCIALKVQNNRLYSLWALSDYGIIAIFNEVGELCYEQKLDAVPTNFYVYRQKVLISFTESSTYGEGIAIITETSPPHYLTIQTLTDPYTPHLYPCSITIDERKEIAYVVHEDGGAITSIDMKSITLQQTFSLGRSISKLYLLPDTRFALASSNMFADLILLDLVNYRLLSLSDSNQEFSTILATLPE